MVDEWVVGAAFVLVWALGIWLGYSVSSHASFTKGYELGYKDGVKEQEEDRG